MYYALTVFFNALFDVIISYTYHYTAGDKTVTFQTFFFSPIAIMVVRI